LLPTSTAKAPPASRPLSLLGRTWCEPNLISHEPAAAATAGKALAPKAATMARIKIFLDIAWYFGLI